MNSPVNGFITQIGRRLRMRRIVFVVALAGVVACMAPASVQADGKASPTLGVGIPPVETTQEKETKMTIATAQLDTSQRSASDTIRPFNAHVSDEALADLRRRLQMTRWPDKETVADPSQGAQLAQLQELVRYWGS